MVASLKVWWDYFKRANTKYKLHSTWIYDIIVNVFESNRYYYDFQKLSDARRYFLSNKDTFPYEEMGAGSRKLAGERSIHDVAKHGISSEKQCRQLFNLADHLQSKQILELGTSLGLSSAYLGCARKTANVTTVEGNPSLAKIASELHRRLGLKNINVVVGNFDTELENVLKNLQDIDFLYLDGNHRKDATLNYFHQCVPHLSSNAVIVLDDIHWSPDMYEAWTILKQNPLVVSCIETAFMGLIFLDKAIPKHDIVLIDYKLKPWQIGLWS